jgi:hypothetical protein
MADPAQFALGTLRETELGLIDAITKCESSKRIFKTFLGVIQQGQRNQLRSALERREIIALSLFIADLLERTSQELLDHAKKTIDAAKSLSESLDDGLSNES